MPSAELNNAIARAEQHSPYLRRLMALYPDEVSLNFTRLSRAKSRDDVSTSLDTNGLWDSSKSLGQALREAKSKLALQVALGDLSGELTLEQFTGALSDFADFALNAAIAQAIADHVPGAEPLGLAAIALGKHGSQELNYSSDLDPILIFDPETLPHRAREDVGEAAVRIGRRVVELMQARTEHGYVFRIDLRLRPSPEITPIVLPVNAALSYYESQAATWERAAFIRARACAGDVRLGQGFLDAVRPFVWRRGLDFGAIKDIRAMSHRIRDHHNKGQAFGPGYDLKRGRGGIRECEFFAQIHQLIHGGRDASLRDPATIPALFALAEARRIDRAQAETLSNAYRLYRTIEHRLQMVDDQQTHQLPLDGDALTNVAQLHGLEGGAALLDVLSPPVAAVGRIYDALDGEASEQLPLTAEPLAETLVKAGFATPAVALARIADWRSGRVRAVRSAVAKEAVEAVLPRLIEALGAAPDPNRAINQLSTLIERLPTALNLFRLLDAQPALLRLLLSILSHAPTLADALARRPELLDRLIDASAFDPPGDVAALSAEMTITSAYEDQLDHIRRTVSDWRFGIGVQIIEGATDPLDCAAGYARVAEAAVNTVADAAIAEFERPHGTVPGSELVILALGRMGGGELTHASDLDLIYLFTGDFRAESDGPKPLGAVHYFNRLAGRVTGGLSVPTAAGPLYEVDTRLRPSGADGPLVVSLDGFARYQAHDAWTWEHMALTRARVIYGSEAARAATQAIIDKTLHSKRDPAKLTADAVKMRRDMRAHKPPQGTLDVKLGDGGLVDLEFAVHVTQLASGKGFSPHLGTAIIALINAGLAELMLAKAHADLTRALVTVRLMAPDLAEPDPATAALIARACGAADWPSWLEMLRLLRQEVSRMWGMIEGPR